MGRDGDGAAREPDRGMRVPDESGQHAAGADDVQASSAVRAIAFVLRDDSRRLGVKGR